MTVARLFYQVMISIAIVNRSRQLLSSAFHQLISLAEPFPHYEFKLTGHWLSSTRISIHKFWITDKNATSNHDRCLIRNMNVSLRTFEAECKRVSVLVIGNSRQHAIDRPPGRHSNPCHNSFSVNVRSNRALQILTNAPAKTALSCDT